MNKERIIFLSRILLVAGVVIIASAVFVESWDVARLSSLKAKKSQMEYDRDHDFFVEAPVVPVNEKDYIIEPEKPGDKVTDEEKASYEKKLEETKVEKEKLDKEYEKKKQDYDKALKQFNLQKQDNRRKYVVSDGDYWKNLTRLGYSIKQKEIDINKMWFSLVLRFVGSIVLLLGSLGVLMYGEMYERLGVLFLVGFAFKTIVGL